jgi:hypothetical protein
MIKKSPPQQQNIYQNQSKQTKNREAHGGVRQDKYAEAPVRGASFQPFTRADPPAYARKNTKSPRTKKHSTKRRLSQLATWVEDPIVFTIRQKATKKGLSLSETIRKLLIKALKDEESVEEALDTESLRESVKRDNQRLARRLSWLLIWLIFDVGHIKVHTTNLLGIQKGMTEEMLKDILRDADRQTKTRLSRKNPELTEFVDAIEKWLVAEEKDLSDRQAGPQEGGGEPNGKSGRGDRSA